MIDRNLAKKLTRQFAGKPGFPKADTPEGKAALTNLFNAFQEYCSDEMHARLVADDLTVENHFCPTSAEIYRVAMATRAKRKPRYESCPRCGGTGWLERTVERQRLPGVAHSMTATAMAPCACRAAEAVLAGVSDDIGEGV